MTTWTTMDDLSTGDLVTEADMDAIRGNIEYLLNPNTDGSIHTEGSSYTTTSTTFVSIDAADMSATVVTNGGPVLIMVGGAFSNSGANNTIYLDIDIDGTRVSGDNASGIVWEKLVTATAQASIDWAVLAEGLSAASHVFTLQWRTSAGTASLSVTAEVAYIQAIEI